MSPNIAASVKARLLKARNRGEEFERTLSRFANERFLYRLGESPARQRWVLKGASLLAVWLSKPYRATRDIDFLAFGEADGSTLRTLLQQICAVSCPEDGLGFDLRDLQIEPIRVEAEYAGNRARFVARLGSAVIRMQIDFGFGDAVSKFDAITFPTLLRDLPAPRVRAYPREASIAEKLEAMVELGDKNSRMKDFHDVWALSEALPFDGPSLMDAIAACFDRRGKSLTADLPRALTPSFYDDPETRRRWARYLEGTGLITAPPARFDVIGGRVIMFLGPACMNIAARRSFEATWPPGGPWKS
jgi:predicted nucleotidyltransferase component of viral defense system